MSNARHWITSLVVIVVFCIATIAQFAVLVSHHRVTMFNLAMFEVLCLSTGIQIGTFVTLLCSERTARRD